MQTLDALTVIFRHNRWANLSLFALCAGLSDEQLDTSMVGVFGSLRATLHHIVTSERSYFSRISTGQMLRWPGGAPPETMAELEESLRLSGDGLVQWAAQVRPDETVTIDWDGTPREVPKTFILTQVINHATEHRAQIMAMLTQLGIEPPELSGWEYFDAFERTAGQQ